MSIKFKCPHCKKPLAVKDEFAGKRANCPACKKPILIPAPIAPPADLEAYAAAALTEEPAAKEQKPPELVEFDCPMCGDAIKMPADLAGKQGQCPACRNIIKVPQLKSEKPKDWREIGKKGPAAALINLPEQLEDAWGTELKGRVSRESLEDAGAIEVEVEPVGAGGWIKRGLIAAALVGFVALLVIGVKNRRADKIVKDAFADALEEKKKLDDEKDPKKKLHPVLVATIDWAEGVRFLQQDKADKAREKFMAARGRFGGDTPSDMLVDVDLFLIELARAQLDLGSDDEDRIRAKARMDWTDKKGSTRHVQKEVSQTLDRIKTPEARVIAVLEIFGELLHRGQKELAIQVAAGQSADGTASPVYPHFVAILLAHGDVKRSPVLIKPPNPKVALELPTRLAYAEGNARKGEYEEAMNLVIFNGLAAHKREAAIDVACVLLTDKSNKDAVKQAGQFVDKAMQWYMEKGVNLNQWHTLQVCRAAYRFPNHAAAAKELADKLPKNFKPRAQLEWLYAQLEKDEGKADELVKNLPDPEGPARGLAWLALGRHFGGELTLPDGANDAAYRVFAKIGQALGK